MDSIDYQNYLDQLISTLRGDPSVVGLIALGSTADASSRDRWSDHDFWVITSPGSQAAYLDTFSWLPRADDILVVVRHGPSRRTVLYENKHKAEYAVFDPDEAVRGKIERFQVLIDRQNVRDLAGAIQLRTQQERSSALARPDMLENLCSLLWAAHERWGRGERLSSQQYIQFAVDRFLDLLLAHGCLDRPQAADMLDPRRRLEEAEPELAQELSRMVLLAPALAGVAMIDSAEARLRAGAPELAWDRASAIRKWLQEAGGPSSGSPERGGLARG